MDISTIIKVVVAFITVMITFISSFVKEFNGGEIVTDPVVTSSTQTQPVSSGTTVAPPSTGTSGTFTITAYGWATA